MCFCENSPIQECPLYHFGGLTVRDSKWGMGSLWRDSWGSVCYNHPQTGGDVIILPQIRMTGMRQVKSPLSPHCVDILSLLCMFPYIFEILDFGHIISCLSSQIFLFGYINRNCPSGTEEWSNQRTAAQNSYRLSFQWGEQCIGGEGEGTDFFLSSWLGMTNTNVNTKKWYFQKQF